MGFLLIQHLNQACQLRCHDVTMAPSATWGTWGSEDRARVHPAPGPANSEGRGGDSSQSLAEERGGRTDFQPSVHIPTLLTRLLFLPNLDHSHLSLPLTVRGLPEMLWTGRLMGSILYPSSSLPLWFSPLLPSPAAPSVVSPGPLPGVCVGAGELPAWGRTLALSPHILIPEYRCSQTVGSG